MNNKIIDLEKYSLEGIPIPDSATEFDVRLDDQILRVDSRTFSGHDLMTLAGRVGEPGTATDLIFIRRINTEHDGHKEIRHRQIYHPITIEDGMLGFLTSHNSEQKYEYVLNGRKRYLYSNIISGCALCEKAGADRHWFRAWRRIDGEPRWPIPNDCFVELDMDEILEFSTEPAMSPGYLS